MSQLCLGRGVAKLLAGACALLLAACAGNFPRRPSSAQFPEQPGLPSRRTTATDADALILLSIEENGFAHLFAYGPPVRPLTRLTYGAWNDAAPSPSPDGGRIAFASDRNGSWDLYVLDIQSGEVIQLTDTPEYDSAPAWSPDGRWLAFETYLDDNLELAILPLDGSDAAPIRLTDDPAADHSPAWSPDGRRIAFVSTRGQGSDIWLAELDRVEAERFRNLTNTPKAAERYPAWSPDGSKMIWYTMSQDAGFSGIYLLEIKDGLGPPRWIGDGARATWNTAGDQVLASLTGPNQSYLTAFDLNGGLALPPIVLPGVLRGLASAHMELPDSLPASLAGAAAETPVALWAPAVTPASNVPARRWYVVDLEGVEAPYPQLHDLVDESFSALRERVLQESGWDALASLENAFVPLSTALDPGLQEDWLYTGRAFAMNTLMGNAGWMVVVREDFGARTYWRVYLRCTLQDGSLGEPLHDSPWDLSARYELDPLAYEEGGRFGAVPSGYWVDITALAAAYRWERLPALPNWRSYYGGTRFTEFALTGGLEWYRAMLELYPADALITPTRVMPPTNTPTRPPPSSATPAPTRTPRPTATPSQTMTPSATPLPSPTPPTIIP